MENNLMENNSIQNNSTENIYSPDQLQISESVHSPARTKGSAAKLVVLALCCSLAGGVAGAGSVVLVSSINHKADMLYYN